MVSHPTSNNWQAQCFQIMNLYLKFLNAHAQCPQLLEAICLDINVSSNLNERYCDVGSSQQTDFHPVKCCVVGGLMIVSTAGQCSNDQAPKEDGCIVRGHAVIRHN